MQKLPGRGLAVWSWPLPACARKGMLQGPCCPRGVEWGWHGRALLNYSRLSILSPTDILLLFSMKDQVQGGPLCSLPNTRKLVLRLGWGGHPTSEDAPPCSHVLDTSGTIGHSLVSKTVDTVVRFEVAFPALLHLLPSPLSPSWCISPDPQKSLTFWCSNWSPQLAPHFLHSLRHQ